jgi:transcriptional regulator MraZ
MKRKGSPLFVGEFRHSLDAKGRLVLPAQVRSMVEEGAVLTRSNRERYLLGFTARDFDDLGRRLAEHTAKDPQRRMVERFWFASARQVELDRSGRILIPQALREYAGLETDVVVAGVNECFEIWDQDRYDAEQARVAAAIPDIITDVPELGF